MLRRQRARWLNPPEWIEPIAVRIDAEDGFADVPAEARSLIRHSAIMAAAARDARLKKRTLTNLYNERPTWLRLAPSVRPPWRTVGGHGGTAATPSRPRRLRRHGSRRRLVRRLGRTLDRNRSRPAPP